MIQMVKFKITIHKIRVAYLAGVAFEAPDVVLLVQRHQRLPVLEILRAAGAPVLHRRRASPAPAPVGHRLRRRLDLLRPTRLGGAVEAVPVGVGGRVPLVAVGRGRRLPALDALLTKALLAREGDPLT